MTITIVEQIIQAVASGRLRQVPIDDRNAYVRSMDALAARVALETGIVEAASPPDVSAIIYDGDLPIARQHNSVWIVGYPRVQRLLTVEEQSLPEVRLSQWCGIVTLWREGVPHEFDGRY